MIQQSRFLNYQSLFLLCIFAMACSPKTSQNTSNSKEEMRPPNEQEVPLDNSGEKEIFTILTDPPRFAACEDQGLEKQALIECAETRLITYAHRQRRYPQEAASEGIEGKVIIKVVVNEDGSLSDPTLSGVTHYGLGEAALKVLDGMPKWVPGKHNGKVVKAYGKIPVSFYLE